MRRFQLILAVILIAATFGYAQPQEEETVSYKVPQEYEIGGIEIKGVQHLDPKILKSIAGLKVGQTIEIPGDKISGAIQELWDQGLFTDVNIYASKFIGNKVFLEYHLEERPRLSRYKIRGLKKNKADDLRDKLDLVKGRVVTENTKVTSRNTIKSYLNDKSFLNAEVNIIEKSDTVLNNSVMLIFDIEKNKKVRIGNISFSGNEKISDTKLKQLMDNTHEKVHIKINKLLNPQNHLSDSQKIQPVKALGNISLLNAYSKLSEFGNLNFFSPSKFIREDYEEDKDKIIRHYLSKGYRDAEITHDTVYLASDGDLEIHMNIDEGQRYYFRHITWEGNTKYSDERLSNILGIEKGEVYNKTKLSDRLKGAQPQKGGGLQISSVSSLYMNDGHLFFNVKPQEVRVVEDSIDINIVLQEGPQATIDRVLITGNTKTHERVIRRELRTLPGHKFSRQDIVRSQREIANLGFFNPKKTNITPIPNREEGTVDIEYDVQYKPSDQLELSAGWGGRGRGLVGTLGVKFTNFSLRNIPNLETWSPLPSGDGQQFSLRVQTNGRVYQSYNMSFTEPWLGGTEPNSLSFSVYRSRFADLDNQRDNVIGKQITNGGTISFGRQLQWPDDYFTLQSEISFQNFIFDNFTRRFNLPDGNYNNLSLKETITRTSLDKKIYPTRGSKISFSVQLTPPYSLFVDKDYKKLRENGNFGELYNWVEYHKWRFDAEWYTPITDKLVIKTRTKFGFLGKYNNNIGLSPFERFELGGDGISNTSFYGREIISMRGYDVFTPNLGAPIYDKLTLELRYPFSLNRSSTIFALAFLEGGNAWNNFNDFNPLEVKRTAGLGVRVYLPMFGMLGFDYGIPFDSAPSVGNSRVPPHEHRPLPPADNFGGWLKRGKFNIILGFEPE